MTTASQLTLLYSAIGLFLTYKLWIRLRLSRAKHPSLRGHSKMSRRVAKWIPYFSYSDTQFFNSDAAPDDIVEKRRQGFTSLTSVLTPTDTRSIEQSSVLEDSISDVQFTNQYRVPFPYQAYLNKHIQLDNFATETDGVKIKNGNGQWHFDLFGSYGVNIFGYDFYKACMQEGYESVKTLGPVLGPYHPVIEDNVKRLLDISGLDEVSFHMSGTEAVMQAVRLARYHTGRSHLVRFCGAYHGWWDGVQPGIGNQRKTQDVYTLKDMDADTLKVLKTRNDIACVLINPLQALHPNANAPGDAMLINSSRSGAFDKAAYQNWLQQVQAVCKERNIVFILDEVFVGFRLAYRGAQEYFNLQADLVTYGKSLGGGLPVGVVCGKHQLMKRFKENQPSNVCFARGTFNSHPYVLGAMNAFLRKIDTPEIKASYAKTEALCNQQVTNLNQAFERLNLPVKMINFMSIWTVTYTKPSRYNWLYQYYLRANGLALSWVGSGRFIFSHNYTEDDYHQVAEACIKAAEQMVQHGWWWDAPQQTNRSISKGFLIEMIKQRLSSKAV